MLFPRLTFFDHTYTRLQLCSRGIEICSNKSVLYDQPGRGTIEPQAEEQKEQGYRDTLRAAYGSALRLRTYSVVAIGFERLVWQELPLDD